MLWLIGYVASGDEKPLKLSIINWKKLSSQANLYFPFFHVYDLYLFLLKLITQEKNPTAFFTLNVIFIML